MTGDETDVSPGSRIELPFWLAKALAQLTVGGDQQLMQIELPKAFGVRVRNALDASPSSVDYRLLCPFFYVFGHKLLDLVVLPELAHVLESAFKVRLRGIMDYSQSGVNSMGQDFIQKLDETEKESHNVLLSSLKDFNQCDESLTELVKRSILEPFQSDPGPDHSRRQGTPTGNQDYRHEAIRLSPLAMSIVNQNIDSLKRFNGWIRTNTNPAMDHELRTKWISSIKACLFDTSFCAIAALKLMNVYAPLNPLDIEKTTSNLICNLVNLGEWPRALEELASFRQHLASLGCVRLNMDKDLLRLTPDSTKRSCHDNNDNNRTPLSYISSDHKNSLVPRRSSSLRLTGGGGCCLCDPPNLSSWEETMIHKYADLFTLPIDAALNERSMVLLVLAYQMNVIRCWCSIYGGAMIKYLIVLMDRPGNFTDWCKRLMPYDDSMAKKQLDLLRRHLVKTAEKASKIDGDPLMIMAIQALALRSAACSRMVPLESICSQFLLLGSQYEKSTSNVKYNHLQAFCSDLLHSLDPVTQTPSDLEAYFELCEYFAYVSRKANIYPDDIFSYKSLIQLPDHPFDKTPTTCYYATHDTLMKLLRCTLQMYSMIYEETYVDLQPLLLDANSSIDTLIQVVQIDDLSDSSQAAPVLDKLGKIIRGFCQSSNQLWEMAQRHKIRSSSCPSALQQSPESMELSLLMGWEQHTEDISNTLNGCRELLRLKMILLKKLKQPATVSPPTSILPDMLLTYVHTMIVLAKTHFDTTNDDAHYHAFEYLDAAERLCSDYGFFVGYRGISAAYYTFGAAFVKLDSVSKAVYPLRKSCTVLELVSERVSVDADKLQLVKRYEVLGSCFTKDGDSKGAVKAYRMALKYIPAATLHVLTAESDQLAISTLIERQPLIPRLMECFIRATFSDDGHPTTYATELMDLATLTPTQQCVLHECELRVLLGPCSRHTLTTQQVSIISTLLQHYTYDQHPIRRTRTLLSKVRMMHAKGDNGSVTSLIQYVLEAQELLKTKDFGLDGNLQGYQRHYMALTCFWMGILLRELDQVSSTTFVSALRQWTHLLENIHPLSSTDPPLKEDVEKVHLQIDDLDALYDHLRTLADLLGLLGYPLLQVNALRLLLKLNSGLRDSAVDCYSDSVVITADIGRIYTDLGYSGKAGVEFAKVDYIAANYPCSNQAELHYLIQCAHYLSSVGDYERSQATFNASKTMWDRSQQLGDPSLKSWGPITQHAINHLMLSDCHLVRSDISLHKESLDMAISDATASYRVLTNFLDSIKKSSGSQLGKSSTFTSTNSYPWSDQSQGSSPRQSSASDIVFNEYQSATAMKLGACFERLATLHMTRGTWVDAQRYLLQGQQLGERVKSKAMVFKFLLLQSDSYLRIDQADKSKSCLEAAAMMCTKGSKNLWDAIALNSASGNLYAHITLLDEALESYKVVDKLFLRMMDPEYIASLETLPESDECLEHQTKKICDVNAVEEDLKDATQTMCHALREKQVENSIRILLVMAKKGALSSGLKTLEKLQEAGNSAFLKATCAHVRLMVVKEEVLHHINMSFMENSVLSLAQLRSSSQGSGSDRATHNIHWIRGHLKQALECIWLTLKKCSRMGTVAVVEQLFLDAGSAMFLHHHISNSDTSFTTNASITAYYFEMAKCIGIRREMQTYLDQRLLPPPNTTKNDLIWPKAICGLTDPTTPNEDSRSQPPLLPKPTAAHLLNLRQLYQQEYDLDGTEFQHTFIDILPPHWTVCSLSLDVDDQVLYATRYRANEPPFVLRLPLGRTSKRQHPKHSKHISNGISYQEAVKEFKSIMDLNDETMHSSNITMLKKDVEGWWMARSQLDIRLKLLLEDMERSWIGGFKGLFSGRHYTCAKALDSFRQELVSILMTNVYGLPSSITTGLLCINEPILHLIVQLGTNPTDHELEDIVYFLLACFENHDLCMDYSEANINRMIQQIRQIVRSYHKEAARQTGINTMERLPNEHVILIPDKHTGLFPLESLPTLRSQPVSRLPCLSFLRDRVLYTRQNLAHSKFPPGNHVDHTTDDRQSNWKDYTIDTSKSYYILDPNNDMEDTRVDFERQFTRFETKITSMKEEKRLILALKSCHFYRMHSWEGCTGKPPSEIECRTMLMEKELYMYFGSSAGQPLLRKQTIRKLPRCSVVLLMGCNSTPLHSTGEYDEHGYYLDYLLAGSPALLTNLWSLTGKNIHQISQSIMGQWRLFSDKGGTVSLVQALSSSRDDCQFPYLVGASSVVFGVPVYAL
ncbi:hypothetical protein [Absidia glauca]|uniref:separase n=1 Tax=Absidia glauca TaxID=4829 RepID=A0A163J1B1_ABSGL|nr:hypothetical protein [Absidia glauca]